MDGWTRGYDTNACGSLRRWGRETLVRFFSNFFRILPLLILSLLFFVPACVLVCVRMLGSAPSAILLLPFVCKGDTT